MVANQIFYFSFDEKVKLIVLKNKFSLSLNFVLLKVGILAEDYRDFTPAINSQNRDRLKSFERQNSLVINNGGLLFESVKFLFVNPVRFNYLPYCTNSELSRKPKLFPNGSITGMMEFVLGKFSLFKSYVTCIVAGIIESLYGLQKRCFLFLRGKEFNFNCK